MPWSVETVNSWMEFRDRVRDLCETSVLGTAYRFRGQADSEWKLESSLTRCLGYANDELSAYKIECLLKKEFHALAPIHLPGNIFTALHDNTSATVWWTVMQHYGAPTRLLDWSEAPAIGAYFAAEGEPDKCGVVYAVDALAVHQSCVEKHPRAFAEFQELAAKHGAASDIKRSLVLGRDENPDLMLFATPNLRIDRMIAQKAAFSLPNKIVVNQEAVIARILDGRRCSHPPAIKFKVPDHAKYSFMDGLVRINIGAHSLFPGVDGVGRRIAEIARFGKAR